MSNLQINKTLNALNNIRNVSNQKFKNLNNSFYKTINTIEKLKTKMFGKNTNQNRQLINKKQKLYKKLNKLTYDMCSKHTEDGLQCLNQGSLNVMSKDNMCKNYCLYHSDKWIESMTTNPYILLDKNNNIVDSDLIYDVRILMLGNKLTSFFDFININGKYIVDFKINKTLNLSIKANELVNEFTNDLVEEFTKQESSTIKLNGFNDLVEEFTNQENSTINLDVEKYLQSLNIDVKEKITDWLFNKDNNEVLNLSNCNLYELPILPNGCVKLNISNNNLSNINNLPTDLIELDCSFNNLKFLYDLPENLQILKCNNNKLIFIKNLPENLKYLNCKNNNLIILPNIEYVNTLLIDENIKLSEKQDDIKPELYNIQKLNYDIKNNTDNNEEFENVTIKDNEYDKIYENLNIQFINFINNDIDKKWITEYLNIQKLSNEYINEYLKSIDTTSIILMDTTTKITTNITAKLFKNNYKIEYAFIDLLKYCLVNGMLYSIVKYFGNYDSYKIINKLTKTNVSKEWNNGRKIVFFKDTHIVSKL